MRTALITAAVMMSSTLGIGASHAQTAVHNITLTDARPAYERLAQNKPVSLNIMSCGYGIMRLADWVNGIDRLPRLQAALHHNLAAELAGRTITVKSYTVYLNQRAAEQKRVDQYGGLTAMVMTPSAKICTREQAPYGFIEPTHVFTGLPLIAAVTVTVDGKDYQGRGTSSGQGLMYLRARGRSKTPTYSISRWTPPTPT